MTGSIDALYRDWRRWHDKLQERSEGETVESASVDRWWALHLAQFRTLIDPLHVAARAERVRKDRNPVRPRTDPVQKTNPPEAMSLTIQRE